jgi:signal transduction histidine kinase
MTTKAARATTGATTDPPARTRRRWRWGPIPVRTRIAATIAVVTAVAMASAGLIVYVLESQRIDSTLNQQIDQEIEEFRVLEGGLDPETGEPFEDVERLLRLFLERNVTDDDEMLVIYVDGQARQSSPNQFGQAILDDPAYQQAIDRLSRRGGTEVIDSARYHEVWVTRVNVEDVRSTTAGGALVIINYADDERSELDRTMQTYGVVTLIFLGFITLLALWRAGRLLAPLTALRSTAAEIGATDLSRRIPEQGNDDITALTRTINGMLERLDSGFTAQRQFLDDAGHELKTPLTVLRGHLELLDHGDPAELAETRDLLLDEVDRMSRLVGDLILLAKTRRPDFLVPGEVDLDHLTRSLLAKARALGERDWQLDETAAGTAVLDEQKVTQAVLQLADNAVKHTDPGDTVAIGSAREGGRIRLWVRDTGDGIAPADREAVLERFGRGRVRPGDDGFGLGLSIVRAIADAHGGEVVIEDARPRGAHVEITLPERAKETTWPRS